MAITTEFRDVVLERLKFALFQEFSKGFVDSIDVECSEHYSFISDNIAMRVSSFVWAEDESAKKYELEYPADWWQAFKERWYPQWLKNCYPVINNKLTVDVQCIYPDFQPAVPDQEYRLAITKKHIYKPLVDDYEGCS